MQAFEGAGPGVLAVTAAEAAADGSAERRAAAGPGGMGERGGALRRRRQEEPRGSGGGRGEPQTSRRGAGDAGEQEPDDAPACADFSGGSHSLLRRRLWSNYPGIRPGKGNVVPIAERTPWTFVCLMLRQSGAMAAQIKFVVGRRAPLLLGLFPDAGTVPVLS
ncbi:UNVERIFIED_CONTAM: hypothetical protein K2H54_002231 [Gekko kuhli]